MRRAAHIFRAGGVYAASVLVSSFVAAEDHKAANGSAAAQKQQPHDYHASTAVVAQAGPDFLSLVGNTPLVEARSLSNATGCRILLKCEHMNPGGSIKDRPAANILLEAERQGLLVPRHLRAPGAEAGTIVEGSGGNTSIALALLALSRGYKAIFAVPASISQEKIDLMRTFGAEVRTCPAVPFADPTHYYQVAKSLGNSGGSYVWGNQFEGEANWKAHYNGTGPEIWKQAGGRIDGLVLAAGTGGSISGLSQLLKEKNPHLNVKLIDPPGSALASYVTKGELAPSAGSTICEGVGILRLTANFAAAKVDGAYIGNDEETVAMAYYLLRREGIFVGPSAAMNVVGAVKLARELGPGHTIVTVLCDGGDRYRSKLYNPAFLESKGLTAAAAVDTSRDHADFVK